MSRVSGGDSKAFDGHPNLGSYALEYRRQQGQLTKADIKEN